MHGSSSSRKLLIHNASASVTHLSSSCRRYAMCERKGQAYGTYLQARMPYGHAYHNSGIAYLFRAGIAYLKARMP